MLIVLVLVQIDTSQVFDIVVTILWHLLGRAGGEKLCRIFWIGSVPFYVALLGRYWVGKLARRNGLVLQSVIESVQLWTGQG